MELMHPKLRRALLNDPKHKKAGLRPDLLVEYEGLVTQFYYLVKYPPEPPIVDTQGPDNEIDDPKRLKSKQTRKPGEEDGNEARQDNGKQLQNRISKFISDFMPNFDRIHSEFVAGQKRVVNRRNHDLAPEWVDKILGKCLIPILWLDRRLSKFMVDTLKR